MKYQKQIFFILIICILILLAYYFELPQLLTIESIKHHKLLLLKIVDTHYLALVLGFIIFYSFITGLSLPGAAALSLSAGFLFGIIPGMLYVLIGATIGASLAFLTVRYIFGTYFQKKYYRSLQQFNQEIARNGAFYLLSLRLIPLFPFFLINILAGLTNISFSVFLLTTLIGITPGAFVFCFAGKRIQYIDKVSDVFTFEMLIVFLLLAVFALIPVLYKKIKLN